MSAPRGFDELCRRELDGELRPEDRAALDAMCAATPALAAERAALGRVAATARSLRAEAPAPSPSFTALVMRRVEEPRRASLWGQLWRPRPVRVRPLWAVAALGALVVAGVALPRGRAPAPAAPAAPVTTACAEPPAAADPDVVLVRFVLPATGARQVALSGDFNGWSHDDTVLADPQGSGYFSVTVPLRRGVTYAYKFLVDGRWVEDPLADAQRPDGFGERNSLLRL